MIVSISNARNRSSSLTAFKLLGSLLIYIYIDIELTIDGPCFRVDVIFSKY